MRRWFSFMLAAMVFVVPASALADINADPAERLVAVTHIDEERAVQLIAGRPRASVRSLTGINGIGRGRIRQHEDASDAADCVADLANERKKYGNGICR